MKTDYVHKDTLTAIDYVELNKNNELLMSYNQALLKENKILKEKYLNAVTDYETTMFEKEQLNSLVNSCQEEIRRLKKQLEENKDKINWYENFEINKTIDKLRIKHNNQQKKFIEYMNKTIEELECDDVDDEEMKAYLIQRIDIYKEILSKYKSIIGGKDAIK